MPFSKLREDYMRINLMMQNKKYQIAVIGLLIGFSLFLIYYFHYMLGISVVFTHFFYIPIILAAIWWKKRGLIVPILLSIALILSHVSSGDVALPVTEDYFRSAMFIFVGVIVVILSDEIEKSKEILVESEKKYRSVVESAMAAIITLNRGGTIVSWNSGAHDIFGYSAEEVIGKSATILMPEEYKKNFFEGLFKFKPDINFKSFKKEGMIALRKNGDDFPFDISVATWSSQGEDYFTAIIQDVTDYKKAEEQLKESLNEKDILLKEIHHRVKNNLMVISSLLSLQSRYIKDKDTLNIFRESQSRARSMALIHEKLYNSNDLKQINFGEYIKTLTADLFYTYVTDPDLIKLNLDVDDVMLDINTVVPLGLIVNELVSNSMKHAFPVLYLKQLADNIAAGQNEMMNEINVNFKPEGDHFVLTVKDNGVGFPEELDFKNTDSLGLRLVNSLTGQIQGNIHLRLDNGTEFKITFKENEY
jgi:PAS domain S-box-containing protein